MEAIEFLKRLDLDKFSLVDGYTDVNRSVYFLDSCYNIETFVMPKKYIILPFKDKTVKYDLGIQFESDFSKIFVTGFGVKYVSTDLSREDREWLEDWIRNLSKEMFRLREEKFQSYLIK